MDVMPRVLAHRKPHLLLFLLLSLNLVLMAASVRGVHGTSLLDQAILSIAAPFLKGAAWGSDTITGLWGGWVGLRGVEQDNRRLRAEVGTLMLQAREAEEARQEVRRLRELLALRDETGREAVAARVIARGSAGPARILLLGSGTSDGVARDQSVITPRGVVGRVLEAASGTSKVQTILDSNSGVAALLQRTRVQGILVGDGEGGCRLEFVSEMARVDVGDVVVTSGLDEIHPKGAILGVVTEVGEAKDLTRRVKVRPEVDFQRIEEVLVLAGPPHTAGEGAP
jgi:rod shape-determining protein MreC